MEAHSRACWGKLFRRLIYPEARRKQNIPRYSTLLAQSLSEAMSLPHVPIVDDVDRPVSAVSTIPPADDDISTPLSPTAAVSPKNGHLERIWRWVQGPVPALDMTFVPLFPGFQQLPSRLFRRGPLKAKKWRFGLLLLFWFLWLSAFIAVVHNSQFRSEVGGMKPYTLSCAASLWYLFFIHPTHHHLVPG